MANPIVPLVLGATATGAVTALRTSLQCPQTLGAVLPVIYWYKTSLTGTGAISCTLLLEQSVDNSVWTTAATVNLSGTTFVSQLFTGVVNAPYVRANVSAINGSGAAVTALLEYIVQAQ